MRIGYRVLADKESLLLIILDDLRWANFCFIRVIPDVTKSTSLAQEVPALIQFNLDFLKALTVGLGECPLPVQSVFLFDKALDVIQNRLILGLILHESLLHRGPDRNGHKFMVRPPRTVVNRSSGQHTVPGAGSQKKEKAEQTNCAKNRFVACDGDRFGTSGFFGSSNCLVCGAPRLDPSSVAGYCGGRAAVASCVGR